jgi:hypothetical protein
MVVEVHEGEIVPPMDRLSRKACVRIADRHVRSMSETTKACE